MKTKPKAILIAIFLIMFSLVGILVYALNNHQKASQVRSTAVEFYIRYILVLARYPYQPHQQEGEEEVMRSYFTKSLYALYHQVYDLQPHGEIGCIDFMVVLGAQDIPLDFEISQVSVQQNKALVHITMWGKKYLIVQMILKEGIWKIDDFIYLELKTQTTLREYLQDCLTRSQNEKKKKFVKPAL